MRILHIISGDLWAGAETQAYLLLKALREEKGLEVQAMLFNQGILYDRLKDLGIEVHLVEEHSGFIKMVKESKRTTDPNPPDLVVSHGYKEAFIAYFLKRKYRAKFVTMYHGLSEVYSGFKQIKSSIFLGLQSFLARHISNGIITISNTLASELSFFDLRKQFTVLNCAQVSGKTRSRSGNDSKAKIVIVGRLVPIKRVDIAIKAMLGVKIDAVLDIVGDGPEEENLKLIAEQTELSEKINFLGFRKDAGSLITNADLLLLTSDHEGVPTVILEAASSGIPIVCTKLAGIQEALGKLIDYPVFYGEKGSVESFEKAINQAFEKHPLGSPINKSAEFEQWFTPAAVAKQHIEIYRSLINT